MQPHVKQSESRRYSLDGWRLVAEGDSSNSPVEGQIVFGSHLSSHLYEPCPQTVKNVKTDIDMVVQSVQQTPALPTKL